MNVKPREMLTRLISSKPRSQIFQTRGFLLIEMLGCLTKNQIVHNANSMVHDASIHNYLEKVFIHNFIKCSGPKMLHWNAVASLNGRKPNKVTRSATECFELWELLPSMLIPLPGRVISVVYKFRECANLGRTCDLQKGKYIKKTRTLHKQPIFIQCQDIREDVRPQKTPNIQHLYIHSLIAK